MPVCSLITMLYASTCSSRDPERRTCFHGNRCMVSGSSSVYTVSMQCNLHHGNQFQMVLGSCVNATPVVHCSHLSTHNTHTHSLCGSSPFLVDSLDLTKDNILSVRYSFHVKYFKEVSSNAKDLVSKMIVKEKRYPTLPSRTHTHEVILSSILFPSSSPVTDSRQHSVSATHG